MYEYKCSNKSCEQIWTIREGNIGSGYLSCPHCKKGLGKFLRQVKDESATINLKETIQKKKIQIDQPEIALANNIDDQKTKVEQETSVTDEKNIVKETSQEQPDEKNSIHKIKMVDVKTDKEDDNNIFDIIMKKRKQEEEFTKNCSEEFDILEITGDTLAEIEKRIKEYEEYYYIKVMDRNIQQQGRRFNCIIKYQRR